jgi:hypothetical protein
MGKPFDYSTSHNHPQNLQNHQSQSPPPPPPPHPSDQYSISPEGSPFDPTDNPNSDFGIQKPEIYHKNGLNKNPNEDGDDSEEWIQFGENTANAGQNLKILTSSPYKENHSLYGGVRHRRELSPFGLMGSGLGKPPRGGSGSGSGSGEKKLWDPDTQFQEIFEQLGTGKEPSVNEISVLADVVVSDDRQRKGSRSPGRVYEMTLDRHVHLLKKDAKSKSQFGAKKIFYKDTGPRPAPSVNSTIGDRTHVIKKKSRGFQGIENGPDLELMLRKGSE